MSTLVDSPKKKTPKKMQSYTARATPEAALVAASTTSPFSIEVRFLGGLTKKQMNAFKVAADRWCKIIVGDLPSVQVDGEVIDDVLILASGVQIDGPGRILGQAGPTRLRPANAGNAAFLPAKGKMQFDTADLSEMEKKGTLIDVITHEMGHVLGIGTVWAQKKLLEGAGTQNPTFTGKNAAIEYGLLRGIEPTPVPVENTGGTGTQDSHWRETIFRNELMSGFIAGQNNPISRVTVASLQDCGYVVDINAAEPFKLPNLLLLAEAGLLSADEVESEHLLINIPTILPEDSLL